MCGEPRSTRLCYRRDVNAGGVSGVEVDVCVRPSQSESEKLLFRCATTAVTRKDFAKVSAMRDEH